MNFSNEIRLSTAVMTHPARENAARRLAHEHPELNATVVVDPEPNRPGTLSCSVAAWSQVGPESTHHLVLQDDVILARGFVDAVHRAVLAMPNEVISLFAEWGSRSADYVRLAAVKAESFAPVCDPYIPTVGIVMPRDAAVQFSSTSFPEGSEVDDAALAVFLREKQRKAFVTVPNLIEHDDSPSVVGNGIQGARHSACFLPGEFFLAKTYNPRSEHPQLAHIGWMRLIAEWFDDDTVFPMAYTGTPIRGQLPLTSNMKDLWNLYLSFFDGQNDEIRLADVIDHTTLFEFWLTSFATGTRSGLDAAQLRTALSSPVAQAALSTALPGAFRRYLAPQTLRRISDQGVSLCAAALEEGSLYAHRFQE